MRLTTPLLLLSLLTLNPAQANPLTIERIFSDPALAGPSPNKLTVAPDGKRVTFIRPREDDFNHYDLWEYNISTGITQRLVDSALLQDNDAQLSDEEKARRERRREYGQGILEYQWAPKGDALLFPAAGDLFYLNLADNRVQPLVQTETFETDAQISPQGRYVGFIREQNLYFVEIATGKLTAVSSDGGGAIKNGMAEFVAQEEMDRMTGYWWSPDDSKIAFLRVDESAVEQITRNEIYADGIKQVQQRYPYTGSANAKLQLAIYDVAQGLTRWIDLGKEQDIYIPRVQWSQDSATLTYQWQSRDQQTLKLIAVDSASGTQRELLTERSKTWINLHHDLRFLKNSAKFIWASERDGYKHLYLYHNDGKPELQLTRGNWVVDAIEAVDEQGGFVYFTGRVDTPTEKQLYRVPLDGTAPPQRISQRAGFHQIAFAEDASVYVDRFSTLDSPPQVSLHRADGAQLTWLEQNAITPQHPLFPYQKDWVKAQFGTLKAADGQTLYYRMLLPPAGKKRSKRPAIVRVYGGPHAQRVVNQWSWKHLFSQYLVQQGYVVFELDNRGSFNRGKAFEDPIYRKLGEVELADQRIGVEFLKQTGVVDSQRIGIYGHSYGGYMALMAMFNGDGTFAAGVSGAPVTDWALYDSHYTERYLGHPADNADGYRASAVFPYVAQLQGDLLIYHGMADDNVLFTHATKLYSALQQATLPFEMMNYPGAKHSIRGKATRIHLYSTIARFFERTLKP